MARRKRYAIVTEDGYTFATGAIDEKQALQALGYEVEEGETALPELEDIKYEQIDFIRGKATDMSVFMRYINQGSFIDATATIRIKLGETMIDFLVFNKETLKTIINALKRALYRLEKTEAVNRRMSFAEIQSYFDELNGHTLSEILNRATFDKTETENKAKTGD